MNDLVQREGLFYEKFTDIPFTGEIDEGLKRGNLESGKLEGPWVGYHENGQLHYKGEFNYSKLEGTWFSYWQNGQLELKGDFRNNK